ncbi:MAG: GDSL-type esterase/lipase family protein [Tannerella sp.]|jgi:lysophospholipase L1-like esterase|nr:GDSL-type esterase/lipase family protein [Tannerella sp.]
MNRNCKGRQCRRTGTGLLAIVLAGWFGSLFSLPERTATKAPSATRTLSARAALTDSVDLQLPFAVDSLCRVSDPSRSLDGFLDGLDQLLAGKDTIVRIVHLGDSHVQAGFYSGQVMRLLHEAFGNAGRGWIAPLKLAGVNEPKDYRITSSTVEKWTAGRCVQKAPECPWGLGGMGLRPESETVDLSIGIHPLRGAGYAFDEVHFYRDARTRRLLPGAGDERWTEIVCGSDPRAPEVAVDTFRLATAVDSLHLYGIDPDEDLSGRASGCYYGFSLLNGRPGILYHAIGQNGAMFVHYAEAGYLRQLSLLEPSLLIVTLGTNEAYTARHFGEEAFVSQMDGFIRLVREYLPSTAILLTTPAESFRRTRNGFVRNENIAGAARAITSYAQAGGLACFDLYRATGGAGSCRKWKEGNMLGRDRVHFSAEGYYEQGKLLYKALVRLTVNRTHPATDDEH